MLVVYMDQKLPVPLTLQDAPGNPTRFIEGRARNALKQLTRVGARPAGMAKQTVVNFIKT